MGTSASTDSLNNLINTAININIKLHKLTYLTGERVTQASGSLLPRPHQNPLYYSPKYYKLALYKAKQAILLLRDLFYFILACLRIMPSLIALSTAFLK